jgi:hypothetical protein
MSYNSVYCLERKRQIKNAVEDWYQSLRKPRNETAKKALNGTPIRTIQNWRSGTFTPEAAAMQMFFNLTGEEVFQLLPEEREKWQIRLRAPLPKRWGEALEKPEPAPKLRKMTTPSIDQEKMKKSLGHLITSMSSALLGLRYPLSLLPDIPANLKMKAADIVRDLIQLFALAAADFEPVEPMEETDPARVETFRSLFALTPKPTARRGQKENP